MKKILALVLSVFVFSVSSISYAAPQNVNGAGAVAIDADGIADGATFTAQGVNESTLTVPDATNINNNSNPVGVTTDVDLKGNIQFAGDSTVNGTVGSALLRLDNITTNGAAGKVVDFNGDVFIGTATLANGSAIDFNANVTATSLDITDINGRINFSGATNSANVTASADVFGTVDFVTNMTYTGNIGAVGFSLSNVIFDQAGSTSITGNIFGDSIRLITTGTTTVTGDITAGTSVNYEGNHTLVLADNSDITGAVTNSSGAATGTLTANGTSTITGQVGAAGVAALSAINGGAAGETLTFNSNVFATTTTVNGTGGITLNGGDLTGTTVNFSADGTLTLADNSDVTAAITTATNNTGTLTANGTSTITGQVGTSSNKLKTINAGVAGEAVTFSNDVFVTTFNVTSGNGNVLLNGNLTGDLVNNAAGPFIQVADGKSIIGTVTTTVDDAGALTFVGNTTVSQNIGVAATGDLSSVEFGNSGISTVSANIAALNVMLSNSSSVTLSGNRTITGALTQAGTSTLDLGTTTLTNAGTVTTGATTTLKSTVASASSFGNIASTGNASVAAGTTVNLNVTGAISSGSALKILDGAAGGAIGTLTIVDNSSRYSFSNSSVTGDLILTATSTNASVASTPNNLAAANALDLLAGASGDMGNIQTLLTSYTNPQDLDTAYGAILPNVNGGNVLASFNVGNQSTNALSDHLGETRGTNGGDYTGLSSGEEGRSDMLWAKGFGSFADQDIRSGIDGYEMSSLGTLIGFDEKLSDYWRLGVAGGYSFSNVDSDGPANGDTDINSYIGSVYGGYTQGPWFMDMAFSFIWNSYESTRDITFPGVNRQATSDYDGQQYVSYIGGGYEFKQGALSITPLASLQWTHIDLEAYDETGASSLNLSVAEQDYDVLQSGLGLKLAYTALCKCGSTFVPSIAGKWLYDFIGDEIQTSSTFSGTTASFKSEGFSPAQSTFVVSPELKLITAGNWTLLANYDLELKEDYVAHNGSVTAKYRF